MIIIDSSAWIDFFYKNNTTVSKLLDDGKAYLTDIVLLEIAPFLWKEKKYSGAIHLLTNLPRIKQVITSSEWGKLTKDRENLINNGLNNVGIPDLFLMNLSKTTHIPIFSLDKHFRRASEILNFKIFTE